MEECKNTLKSEITYGIDCPYIDIQWEKGYIYISNAVFRLIGKPSGIRFQWNAAKCSLIIEPTDINNPDGFPVTGKRYAQRKSMFIGSITLINAIWAATKWDKMLRYRIVAKYNEPSNVAIFELKKAVASEIIHNGSRAEM
jgi:hypothetical protein